ncbi:MAG: AAA family ATPase [Sandarakinorhabdus sp.]|nr:AAA family ATPase [Sandarakinorhabdus sp.]
MTDIFLSYNRDDQATARRFARAFEAKGLRVWWDTTLRAGEAYDEVTEAALRSAKAVVVLWSVRAVSSRWVRAEATAALRNKTLVPCMIEACERPIMFELTQTADLSHWLGADDDPQWLAFLADVMRHVDQSNSRRSQPDAPPGPAAHRPIAASAVAQSERRHLTFLSCRLEDLAAAQGRRDPEDWHAIVSTAQPHITSALEAMGGAVTWHTDEVSAIFGYPTAHEDAAERAIRAGLAIVETMADLHAEFAADHDADVEVRIGLHAANALVSAGRDGAVEIFGDGPKVAAQARAAAVPGSVVFTGDVAELVAGVFDQEGLADIPSMDDRGPTAAFRAVGTRSNRRNRGGRFIGREDELALLMNRWRRLADGDGQHVLIKGEPGIGKSRLLEEFRASISNQPHRWVSWSGVSLFSNTPFYAVIQMLNQMLEARGGDPVEALKQELAAADMSADAFDLVATMIGLTLPANHSVPDLAPVQRRRRLLAALADWVFALTRQLPLVVAVEDLHWVDPSTMELIEVLIDQGGLVPLLLIGTARPEFRKSWPDRDHHGQINLGRLDSRQTRALASHALGHTLGHVIGDAGVDDAIIDNLVKRTDGVPFFIEELARQILAHGSDHAAGDIPTTLRGLLAARIDRLGVAKETAQLGAILGRSFSHAMIAAFSGLDETQLDSNLALMADSELVFVRGMPPRSTYQFKHALTHEAAYELLPKSRRTKEHRRVAALIQAQFSKDAQAHPEIVAHHFSNGGNHEQAARFWLQAGQQALRRNAHLETIAHLENALAAISALPETPERAMIELDIQVTLGTATVVAKGQASPQIEAVWNRALQLSRTLGDIARQGQAIFGLWLFETVGANHQAALAHSNAIVDLAKSTANEDLLITGTVSKTSSSFFLGKVDDVIESSRFILSIYDPERHAAHRFQFGQDPAAMARAYLCQAFWLKGDVAAAIDMSNEALAFARALHHPYTLSHVIAYAGWLHLYLGDDADVEALANELTALCSEEKIPLFLGNGVMLTGWLHCRRGDDDGPAVFAQGLEIYRGTGSRCFLPYRWSLLADALSSRGEQTQASALLAQAFAAIDQTSERWAEPEVHRLHGKMLARAGAEPALVEAGYRRAIASAQALGLHGWERGAAADLADLLHGPDNAA